MAQNDNVVVPFSSVKNRKTSEEKKKDPQIGTEFGIERAMPFSTWGAEGEVRSEAKVKVEDLVEMRRRDGQARALMRLYTLPILAAMLDGEWVAGDTPEVKKAERPAAEGADPEADPKADPKTPADAAKEQGEDGKPITGEQSPPSDYNPEEDPGHDPYAAPEDNEAAAKAEAEKAAKEAEEAEMMMEEEVAFANAMWNAPREMGGMETTKMEVVKKTLSALVDGFSVFEEVRHVPDEGPLKGKITLKKLAYRDPRTITFRVNDQGEFNGVRQVSVKPNGKTVDVKIPPDKVWYWACQEEENPYYGVSLFESAFYHYEIKRKLYYIAHLAAQFAAVPGRVGEFPLGADPRMVSDFKTALANFAFNTAMTHPVGWKVTPFNGSTGFDFIKLIDHHNHMMSKSVVAGFIDSDERAAVIEVNSNEPHSDFFLLGISAIMDDIAESWTHDLMPKYIDWNFGSKKYPKFRFGSITDAAKDVIKELFTATVTSSVLNSTPEFIREMEKKLAKMMDLDIDYDAIEAQEKQAATDEAAQQEAELDQTGGVNPITGEPIPPKPPANPDRPNIPGAQAPGPGGVGTGGGGGGGFPPKKKKFPPGSPEAVAASAEEVNLEDPSIDDLVSMAAQLLAETGDEEPGPL